MTLFEDLNSRYAGRFPVASIAFLWYVKGQNRYEDTTHTDCRNNEKKSTTQQERDEEFDRTQESGACEEKIVGR